jgi:hypothetical protein
VQYLRYLSWYLILATEGEHAFFKREVEIKDVRRVPIKFEGHSVRYVKGHSSVRIEDRIYSELKAYFADIATKHSEQAIGRELRGLPFIRFAPVRVQVYWLWQDVNHRRQAAGLALVPRSYVEGGLKVCRPFEPLRSGDETTEGGVVLSASLAR